MGVYFQGAALTAQRKPTVLLEFAGTPSSRWAERVTLSLPFQDPPRSTRNSPEDGPVGFLSGEFL
jgi:hypothetical protein